MALSNFSKTKKRKFILGTGEYVARVYRSKFVNFLDQRVFAVRAESQSQRNYCSHRY
jgi:hypothetical protein